MTGPADLGHDRPDAGFTLIEVLAALAVFSIAAVGLVHISIENTRATAIVETRALAAIVADNALTDRFSDPRPPVKGFVSREERLAGRDWQVEETIADTPDPLILQVTISARLIDPISEDAGIGHQVTAFVEARP